MVGLPLDILWDINCKPLSTTFATFGYSSNPCTLGPSVGMRLERSLLLSLLLFQMFAWCYTPWNCILSDCVNVHWKPEMLLFLGGGDFAL